MVLIFIGEGTFSPAAGKLVHALQPSAAARDRRIRVLVAMPISQVGRGA